MTHTDDEQLTLDVHLHPALEDRDRPYLTGTLTISGDLHCPHDVQAGDELTVTVANADGEVIANGALVGKYPGFRDIKDGQTILGTERNNKAKVL
jgi:hypothetical protein